MIAHWITAITMLVARKLVYSKLRLYEENSVCLLCLLLASLLPLTISQRR